MLYKFIYYLKINIHSIISFFVSFICMIGVFYFFVPNIIQSLSNYYLYSNICNQEVWFANSPINSNCFINLNGVLLTYKDEKSINADVFMQMDTSSYNDNLFEVDYYLEPKTCAISKNIAVEYELSIGDKIYLKDKSQYEVVIIFNSQSGLDQKYNHFGVIVLSTTKGISISQPIKYIYFTNNSDGFYNVTDFIKLDKKAFDNKKIAKNNGAYLILIMLFILTITEIFIFKKKKNDYKLLVMDGNKKYKLFIQILYDTLIRIILPIILAFLFYLRYIKLFTIGYCVVFINLLAFSIAVAILLCLIYYIVEVNRGKLR